MLTESLLGTNGLNSTDTTVPPPSCMGGSTLRTAHGCPRVPMVSPCGGGMRAPLWPVLTGPDLRILIKVFILEKKKKKKAVSSTN